MAGEGAVALIPADRPGPSPTVVRSRPAGPCRARAGAGAGYGRGAGGEVQRRSLGGDKKWGAGGGVQGRGVGGAQGTGLGSGRGSTDGGVQGAWEDICERYRGQDPPEVRKAGCPWSREHDPPEGSWVSMNRLPN